MPERPQVSEVAEFVAGILPGIPAKTKFELKRLLSHSVAVPTASELREARLGLLVELVSTGELPTVRTYASHRQESSSEDNWPSVAGLIQHYGTWTRSLQAAIDLHFGATSVRARSRSPLPWTPQPYTRVEIQDALRTASFKVGRPITQWEYSELRRIERKNASMIGLPEPRLPGNQVIRRTFGNWANGMKSISESVLLDFNLEGERTL